MVPSHAARPRVTYAMPPSYPHVHGVIEDYCGILSIDIGWIGDYNETRWAVYIVENTWGLRKSRIDRLGLQLFKPKP